MTQILLTIKDEQKGKALLDFLKKIDFIEINSRETEQINNSNFNLKDKFMNLLLNAPTWSEEDLEYYKEHSKSIRKWRTI